MASSVINNEKTLLDEISRLKREIELSDLENEELEQDMIDLKRALSKLQVDYQEAQDALAKRSIQLQSMGSGSTADNSAIIQTLTAEKAALQKRLDRETKELNDKLSATQALRRTAVESSKRRQKQMEAQDKRLTQQEARLKTLEEANNAYEFQNKALLEKLHEQHYNQIQAFQAGTETQENLDATIHKIHALEAEIENQKAANQSLYALSEQHRLMALAIGQEVQKANIHFAAVKQNEAALQSELNVTKIQKDSFENNNRILQESIRNNASAATAAQLAAQQELDALKAMYTNEVEQKQNLLVVANRELSNQHAQMMNIYNAFVTTHQKLEVGEAQFYTLLTEFRNLSLNLTALQEEHTRLNADYYGLTEVGKARIRELENQIYTINNQLTASDYALGNILAENKLQSDQLQQAAVIQQKYRATRADLNQTEAQYLQALQREEQYKKSENFLVNKIKKQQKELKVVNAAWKKEVERGLTDIRNMTNKSTRARAWDPWHILEKSLKLSEGGEPLDTGLANHWGVEAVLTSDQVVGIMQQWIHEYTTPQQNAALWTKVTVNNMFGPEFVEPMEDALDIMLEAIINARDWNTYTTLQTIRTWYQKNPGKHEMSYNILKR